MNIIKYHQLLEDERWDKKVNHILNRDKYHCQDCHNIGSHNKLHYMEFDSIDEALECCFKDKKYREQIVKYCMTETKPHLQYEDIRIEKVEAKNSHYRVCLHIENNCTGSLDFATISILPKGLTATCILQVINRRTTKVFLFNESISTKCNVSIERICGCIMYSFSFKNRVIVITYPEKEVRLNVHHKYYVNGLNPWDYPDEDLITLCEECHKKRHQNRIPIYRNLQIKDIIGHWNTCPKCNGSGYLPEFHYYENGICFRCYGEGALPEYTP